MSEPFRILVVDRNKNVREFLKRELASEGFWVDTAGDGKEVLERMDRGCLPDLLVLDLELPLVDGCQVASRLKQLELRIPVVVHSFAPETPPPCAIEEIGVFVEKSGENVQKLRETIWECLKEAYPARFGPGREQGPVEQSKGAP